jgi:hypothetical protein
LIKRIMDIFAEGSGIVSSLVVVPQGNDRRRRG